MSTTLPSLTGVQFEIIRFGIAFQYQASGQPADTDHAATATFDATNVTTIDVTIGMYLDCNQASKVAIHNLQITDFTTAVALVNCAGSVTDSTLTGRRFTATLATYSIFIHEQSTRPVLVANNSFTRPAGERGVAVVSHGEVEIRSNRVCVDCTGSLSTANSSCACSSMARHVTMQSLSLACKQQQ